MKHNTTVQKTHPLILLTIPKAVLSCAPRFPIGADRSHLVPLGFRADTKFPLGISSERFQLVLLGIRMVLLGTDRIPSGRRKLWGGGWMGEPANIRNVPQWARFGCLAAEESEGHHKRVLMDAFLVSEGRGKGMGASKHQKRAPMGTFLVFGG